MATIDGILEGKTGNYLKLEDLVDGKFQVIEVIDPKHTELRIEKVKATKEGDKDIEYYHILVRSGDVEKDLSLTYTSLKQLAAVMPKENWKGCSATYLGSKGTGKNIKYNFQYNGKTLIAETRLSDIVDPAGKIIQDMKKADLWEDGAFWELVTRHAGSTGAGVTIVDKFKTEGRIYQPVAGKWKVT